MQVLDPANRVISLANDNLPLGARFSVAGSIWDLKSNSQEILRAMRETFDQVSSEQGHPDLYLRFHVDLAVEDAPHPQLARIRRRLNDIYAGELGEPFTTIGLCWYRDGSDSVAWHGDTIGRSSTQDTMVAIVSLGATRTFALRPRGGGPSLRLPQSHGDLLVMGGSCQRTWEHSIPKTSACTGPRISIQFRPRDVR